MNDWVFDDIHQVLLKENKYGSILHYHASLYIARLMRSGFGINTLGRADVIASGRVVFIGKQPGPVLI